MRSAKCVMKVAAHQNKIAPQNKYKKIYWAWLYELCQAYHHYALRTSHYALFIVLMQKAFKESNWHI